jgi:hypothetical protein
MKGDWNCRDELDGVLQGMRNVRMDRIVTIL